MIVVILFPSLPTTVKQHQKNRKPACWQKQRMNLGYVMPRQRLDATNDLASAQAAKSRIDDVSVV